jgi:alkylation response protein AidB-like acyl-CoA dehydrogenase
MTGVETDPLAAARQFAEAVAAFGSEGIESARRLPQPLAERAAGLGLMRMLAPREVGGPEADPATLVRALETIALVDASAAWVVMIAATTSVVGGTYPLETAREALGSPDAVVCGVAAPLGRAIREGQGFRVSGRWAFGSGSETAMWLVGGAVVMSGDVPATLPSGQPETRLCLFPASDVTIHDTWSVSGLRGTGSHDFEVRDIFVPERRTNVIGADGLVRPPLYASIWDARWASPALRSAARTDELVRLAGGKVPIGSQRRLAERTGVQEQVARSEASLRGARAFLFEAIDGMWQVAVRGDKPSVQDRALVRLAATNTAWSAAGVVDAMYSAGGGTSNYNSSPLQRYFRDVHALTQHVMIQPTTWDMTGRVFLGLAPNTPLL